MVVLASMKKRILIFCSFLAFIAMTMCQADAPMSTLGRALWGESAPDRIYFGMFTYHFDDHSRGKDNANNELVGVGYKGYFGGAFKNSYSKLTVAFGLQRSLLGSQLGASNWKYALGYRLGAMIGYDNHLCSYCGKLPAVPFIIPYADFSYRRVGAELQYAYILTSVSFFYRFG